MRDVWKGTLRWSLFIAIVTFFLSSGLDTYTALLGNVPWPVGFVMVIIIVFIGVVFDLIGTAAAAAREVPFHAMAAERVLGARIAIIIVRNAGRFASFCSDVVGDIAGILSGAAAVAVGIQIATSMNLRTDLERNATIIFVTAFVAAITVGCKATGKALAIRYPTQIILWVSRLVGRIEMTLHVRLFSSLRKRTRKRGGKHAVREHPESK